MQMQKIKTSAVLAAIGIGMGLVLSFLLLFFTPAFKGNTTNFLLILNMIMMAGNLFLFHFLVVFANNIEQTISKAPKVVAAVKVAPKKKTVAKMVVKKVAVKKVSVKKSAPKKVAKKVITKKATPKKVVKKTTTKKKTTSKKVAKKTSKK